MTAYIFIDSSIYIRYLTQGQHGCEPEWFQRLEALLNGAARLLVPEIVRLELDKFRGHLENTLDDRFKEMRGSLENHFKHQSGKTWNELVDVKEELLKWLDEKKRQKMDTAERHYRQIQDLFVHRNAVHISFTPDLWFLGKRRIIAGEMPYVGTNNRDRESDACIIESLQSYFEKNTPQGAGAVLYFCSENVQDFGYTGKDGPYLAATVREGLPKSTCFTNLKSLIEFASNPKDVKEPTLEQEKWDTEKIRHYQRWKQTKLDAYIHRLFAEINSLRSQVTYYQNQAQFSAANPPPPQQEGNPADEPEQTPPPET